MLTQLHIRNIVLIDRLELEFSSGLTVLTGETGAGKSILLDALGLALGARADFGLIRHGADKAMVSACFSLPQTHEIWPVLHDAGIEAEDELILRRQLRADGKSQASINDQPVSVGLLRAAGDALIEIQGQFEGRGLLDQTAYLPLIDRACQHPERLELLSQRWREWQQAQQQYTALAEQIEKARTEEEWLRDALEQLDSLAPQPDEEEQLNAERSLHAHAARLAETLQQAALILREDEGAEALTGRAERLLENQLDIASAQLTPAYEALQRARMELIEADAQIQQIADTLDGDPARLSQIDDRLHALRAQARKHNTEITELCKIHDQLRDQLSQIDDGAAQLSEVLRAAEEAEQAYQLIAQQTSAQRIIQAEKLDSAVMAELAPLKLETASFRTDVSPLDKSRWSASGTDKIQFAARTNPGMAEGAIDKIASGGELARFLLALKVALAENEPAKTLIFDEVDSGVGGAVAAAVGLRLARLGGAMQTLVITHSPQVAAAANHHFHIRKTAHDETIISSTVRLTPQERLEEIARMLSGDAITDEARAAAQTLIDRQHAESTRHENS